MIQSKLLELQKSLSDNAEIITDYSAHQDYLHDATIETGTPAAIIFACTDSDIQQVVRFCRELTLHLTVRGAGTGLSGGAVPKDGAILLSVEKMNQLSFDKEKRIAYAQTGVITKTIIDEALQYNLFYPPDPASFAESTIGGNVAENAGGLKCVKYGVTRDYVLGIKAVTEDGNLITTGVYNKKQGFNFNELFIGSEGTLVIITEIALKLVTKPVQGETILISFSKASDAAQTVADIRHSGIVPIVLEFLDGDAADCSNQYEKIDSLVNAAGILLIEAEHKDSDKIEMLASKNRCIFIQRESDSEKADTLWKVRRNLSKAVKEMSKIRINEDVAVPISKFPVLVEFVAEMNKNSTLRINSFGHAGDGNLHVNFLAKTNSKEEADAIEEKIVELLVKTIELGGTLSGEHGIGLAKKKYLHLEFDFATLEAMKAVKDVFNSSSLLNPEKIF